MEFFLFLIVVILIFVTIKYFKNKKINTIKENHTQYRYDIVKRVLKNYGKELDEKLQVYANPLRIKRNQLIYTDDYGDCVYNDWWREIEHFKNTKISDIPYSLLNTILDELKDNYPYDLLDDSQKYDDIDYIKEKIGEFIDERIIEIASQPSIHDTDSSMDVDLTDPVQFEHDIANIFRSFGWDARVTKGSGDQGADVIAENNIGTKLVVQCKLYNQPVGNKAVQEVYSANKFYEGDQAMVVTNSSYTKSAKQLADSLDVMLFHYSELAPILQALNDSE